MKNWAKRRTMHVRVHGPVHGPKMAGTVTREFFCRTSVSEGAARATCKTGQNDVLGTYTYMDLCTDGHTEKKHPGRPFVKELYARHGKLGKTTYYARTRTWTRARIGDVRLKNCITSWKLGQTS